MKRSALALITAVTLGVLGSVTPAQATSITPGEITPGELDGSGPFVINFDENGNGTVSVNGGAFSTLTGSLIANPSNVGLPGLLALTYFLPETIFTGDAGIGGTSDGAGVLSDGLRFTNADGQTNGLLNGDRLIFYSDISEASETPALADTGFPTNFAPPILAFEFGAENTLQRFLYGSPNVYSGISDAPLAAVPEPATLTLTGLGLAGILKRFRSRRSR